MAGAALTSILLAAPYADAAGYRSIVHEVIVPTDACSAWAMWATDEGFQSFFPGGPGLKTHIELRPGGPFEIFIIEGAPEGSRGCDDCVILGFEEGRMFSFTWTNRPDMAVRPHKMHVVLTFEPLSEGETKVTLVSDGFGIGPEWDESYEYFIGAWGAVMAAYETVIEEAAVEGSGN
ncbi:MAG: SRPBCC domain-containing protein [Pseudomonadales bacterium]